MVDLLKEKEQQLEDVRFNTYAEDQCGAAGLIVHQAGAQRLANPLSMLGHVGFSIKPMMLKHFLADWDLKLRYVHQGKNKVRLNRLEEHKQEDIDWMKAIL